MACELYFDDVRGFREASSKLLEKARGVRRPLGGSGGARCSLRLDFGPGVARPPPPAPHDHSTNTSHTPPSPPYRDIPITKEMDEITYWLCTRRAPCLMKHDLAKRRREEAQTSKPRIIGSIHSISDSTQSPTPQKKKRKLSILDDDSVSVKEPKNLYFDTSNQQQNQQTLISSSKSDSADPDFNIKRSSLQDKLKRRKLQKHNRSKLHKRSKLVSSTPIANVRRSLRNSGKGFNNTSQLNSSFEILNENMPNGVKKSSLLTPAKLEYVRPVDRCQKLIDKLDMDLKQAKAALQRFPTPVEKPSKAVNGEFENLSDVSGFTANYIRSTKKAVKNGKKVKSKNCRNMLKDCSVPDQGKLLGCSQEGQPGTADASGELNCNNTSNESGQKPRRVHRRTSLLKFMSPKSPKKECCSKDQVDGNLNSDNLDSSLTSPSKMSLRYPRRHNTSANDDPSILRFDKSLNSTKSPKTRRKSAKNVNNNNCMSSDALPRTRSGRSAGRPPPGPGPPARRSAPPRDRSGFAACFSDSDDEKPLKKQKFFG